MGSAFAAAVAAAAGRDCWAACEDCMPWSTRFTAGLGEIAF